MSLKLPSEALRLLCVALAAAEILPEDECSSGTCSLELHQLRAKETKLEEGIFESFRSEKLLSIMLLIYIHV